jgi:hypothetical protein
MGSKCQIVFVAVISTSDTCTAMRSSAGERGEISSELALGADRDRDSSLRSE